jgi:type II secretory ATPase GspE/PulE/Tfp pilus assembly ATPase PilB-like protein
MAQRPYGMILACGPTGSGKTTTLHSLLSEINTGNRKIWTAEDPIEITQPGLRQLQVNPKIGVTFASAMRAFLRADPDVIMIGEIRDEETARIAVEASLTGHLVLSTLHTNNAAESIVRLLDLGMDPMNFADSLIGLVAQRLVRSLCKNCRASAPLPAQEFERLALSYIEGTAVDLQQARVRLLEAAQVTGATDIKLYRAVGCEVCAGKGYKGRLGIYETVENSPALRQLIQHRAATSLIFHQAIASGARSLKQDALEKAFAGLIDLAQAAAVC